MKILLSDKFLRNMAANYLRRKKSTDNSKYVSLTEIRFSHRMRKKLNALNAEDRKYFLGMWYCKNGYGWPVFATSEFIKEKIFPVAFKVWKLAMKIEVIRRVWEWFTV